MRGSAALARAATLALLIALASPVAQADLPRPPTSAALQGCPPWIPPPAADAAERSAARDQGLLWRLRRQGRTSWLYGSLHLGRPADSAPGPRLLQAMKASGALAVELDLSDPAVLQALQQAPAGPALALSPALQDRLAQRIAAACLPGPALAALHPLMQATALVLAEARWLGLDAAHGSEPMLTRWFRHRGLPVRSLESVREQLGALLPDDPAQARHLLARNLDALESGSVRRQLERLLEAWSAGDLDTLAAYESWCDCIADERDRALLRRLNDARNPQLAERISALHARGPAHFFAVGALHLVGAQALPRLLAQHGFEVTRVTFER